jgi:transcriptional regulator
MYLPEHFIESDSDTISGLIRDFPLGLIVSHQSGRSVADYIPLLLDSDFGIHGRLVGHVARNNRLWTCHDESCEILVVFSGPDSYITPNWYETKRQSHQVVPTWNYLTVHCYGTLVIHDDPKWVRGVVGQLTKTMESLEPTPWKMGDAPQDFLADQIGRIVGIEIVISEVIGKWKASQNRTIDDQEGVVTGLKTRHRGDDSAMASVLSDSIRNSSRTE